MKNFNGEIIFKPKNADKHTLLDIGTIIHNQLRGNDDYVNNNIGIHIGDDSVMVWFDDCKGEIPSITF